MFNTPIDVTCTFQAHITELTEENLKLMGELHVAKKAAKVGAIVSCRGTQGHHNTHAGIAYALWSCQHMYCGHQEQYRDGEPAALALLCCTREKLKWGNGEIRVAFVMLPEVPMHKVDGCCLAGSTHAGSKPAAEHP